MSVKKRLAAFVVLCLFLIAAFPVSALAADTAVNEDKSIDSTIEITEDTVYDLDGKTLTFTGTGSVFRVKSGATLTIEDSSEGKTGKITGGSALGAETSYSGENGFGGGSRIGDDCGGGVFVESGAKLIISGGTITECRALQGGGVFLSPGAELQVSGSARITGNYNGETGTAEDNVWLPLDENNKQSCVVVNGKLDSTAVIGVTTAAVVGKNKTVISSGLKDNGDRTNFTSDEGSYVYVNEKGEAVLTTVKADPDYTKPEGLSAVCGTLFKDIELPKGFEWKYPDSTLAAMGELAYLATYTPDDTENFNVVDDIEIFVTGHGIHHEASDPTCTKKGNIEYWADGNGVAFAQDSAENMLETTDIPALGHDWKEPTYEWKLEDGEWTCTAERVCARDDSHVETENGTVTSEVTKEPTYDSEGETIYTAEFTNPAFTTQTKTVTEPVKKHGWIYNFFKSIWDGFKRFIAWFTADDDSGEVMTIDVPANVETSTEPTCTEKGYRTYIAEFEVDGKTYTEERVETLDQLGHDWGDPEWTWSGDYSEAAATFTCKRDSEHTHTEPAAVTSETTPATTEKDGKTVYTAKAAFDGTEYEDTQTVVIPKIVDSDVPTDSDKPIEVGLLGDVNGDGDIDSADALIILRASIQLEKLTDDQRLLADVNGDGEIDSSDALEVLRYSVKLSANENIGKPVTKKSA